MKRAFLLLPILLLSGCSGQNYASKLNLPAIEAPAVLAPVTPAATGDMSTLISPIENAQTPSQADTAVANLRQATAMATLFGGGSDPNDSPDLQQKKAARLAEFNRLMAYLEQAGQIKRAQLEDGDAKDSTGEVAQRLGYARQSSANLDHMNKDIPKTTFGSTAPQPPTGAASPSTTPLQNAASNSTPSTGVEPPTAAERAWFDNLGNVKKSAPAIGLSDEEKATQLKNEAIEAQAQYKQVPAPPRFATANSLYEAAHAKLVEATTVLERATIARDRDGLTQGEQLLDEAQDLFNKAHAEANLVLDELEGTPRPR